MKELPRLAYNLNIFYQHHKIFAPAGVCLPRLAA